MTIHPDVRRDMAMEIISYYFDPNEIYNFKVDTATASDDELMKYATEVKLRAMSKGN